MEALPLAEVKNRLSEFVERVASQHDRVTITRNGRPAAVLVSPEDLESLEETLAVLGHPQELAAVREGLADLDAGRATTLDELKTKIRESLDHERDHRQKDLLRGKVIEALVKLHDFPVPESLVEHQMDIRLERVVRSLAAQGVDPRAVNVDWVTMRSRQKDRAADDVKAELIVDRIATAENIDITDEELRHELEHAASHSGESVAAIEARLTKQGTLDRMKAKLRSDKTLDWLAQNSQIRTVTAEESKAQGSGS